jgi:hypothetical protein
MKTFQDLEFKDHSLSSIYPEAKQARIDFDNGYGVSVIFGSCFYSNGVDTYEVGVLKDGSLTYDTHITNDVIGGLTADEVTEIMKQVQELT